MDRLWAEHLWHDDRVFFDPSSGPADWTRVVEEPSFRAKNLDLDSRHSASPTDVESRDTARFSFDSTLTARPDG